MDNRIDGICFAVAVGIIMILLFAYTAHKQIARTECNMELPKLAGKYCQQRDHRGNIYYISEDKKVEVRIK